MSPLHWTVYWLPLWLKILSSAYRIPRNLLMLTIILWLHMIGSVHPSTLHWPRRLPRPGPDLGQTREEHPEKSSLREENMRGQWRHGDARSFCSVEELLQQVCWLILPTGY